MHVKFDCLHCDQPLRTRQTEKTRAVRCPACAGKVQIPRSRRPRPVAVLPVVEAAPSRLSSSWNSFKTPLMLGLAFACGAVAILATDSPDLTAGQSFQATPAVYGAASTSQGPTGRNRLTAPFFNVGTKGADAFQAQSVENGQADKPFNLNAGSSGKSDGCAAIDAAAAQTRFAEQRGEKSKSASSVSGGQIGGGRSGGGCSDVKSSGRKESNQSPAFNASVASI